MLDWGGLGTFHYNYRFLGYTFILYLIRIFNPDAKILDGLGMSYGSLLIFAVIIAAIIILTSSFFMRKDASLRKASVVSLVASIISLNLLGIVGSVIGLLKK